MLIVYLYLLLSNIYPAYMVLNALFVPIAACQATVAMKSNTSAETSYLYPSSRYIFIAGIICSWVGDLCLGLSDIDFFIYGVLAFFMSHIAYIILMINITERKFSFNYFVLGVTGITIFLISLVLFFLWESIVQFRWYLVVYSFALLGLCMAAANTAFSENVRPDRAIILMCGAFCFVISDTLIVTTSFLLEQTDASKAFITISYITAQILLIRGITERRLPASNRNHLFIK